MKMKHKETQRDASFQLLFCLVTWEGASPPVFEQIFRNARFAQGGNALFEGKVKGNPKPQVVWTRKGLQMKGMSKSYYK